MTTYDNPSSHRGAPLILTMQHFVNWEFRDKEFMPKWALGLETAEKVLSLSDPGTNYEKAKNVQFSNARRHIGGWIAQSAIFSAVTRRLDPTQPKKRFGWLLEGDKRDITRIGAHMGMSPELLHMLGQITHTCALFSAVWIDHDPHACTLRLMA